MFTQEDVIAALQSIPETEGRLPIRHLGDGIELVSSPAYVNGSGAGEVADLGAVCPDSAVIERPAGFIGTAARSRAYALRQA